MSVPTLLHSRADLQPDSAEIERLARAREAFFASDDPDAATGLRTEIVQSWRRSRELGVDEFDRSLPRIDVGGRAQRLQIAAEPVMRRLGSQLEGSRAWGMLLDRNCTQLGPVVGDDSLLAVAIDRGSSPGARYAESTVGTNGSALAAERLEPFVVVGPEHYRESEAMLASVGAPVRDALNRVVGIVALNCRFEHSSSVLVPFARDVAWAIGHRLQELSNGIEQELFAQFSRLSTRPSQATLAIGDDVLIANSAARQLTMHGVNIESIAQRALGEVQGNGDLEFEISSADSGDVSREEAERLHVRVKSVELSDGSVGAIANLVRPSKRRASTGARSAQQQAGPLEVLRRARRAGTPAYVVGERGSGKRTLALEALGDDGAELDARAAERNPDEWLASLRERAATEPCVLLTHLDDLPAQLRADVARIVDSSTAWFVATSLTFVAEDGPSPLDDRFTVIAPRSPLRERREGFADIVANVLRGVDFGEAPIRCSPEALAVLSKQPWPGNISQLRRILVTSAMRSTLGEIQLDHIPPNALMQAQVRGMTKLERLEREMILESLHEASWNREDAAKSLGISRATMYRKLKQFEISVPSSRR